MKVLGFWNKLFTACVSVVEFKTLSDNLETLSKENTRHKSCINDLNNTIALQKTTIADLRYEISNPTLPAVDSTELDNEKEKHKLTLKLLEDAQSEINSLKEKKVVEESVIPYEESICGDKKTSKFIGHGYASDKSVEPVLNTVKEKNNIVPAKAIVDNSDNIQKFLNTLTDFEKKQLKKDILKGHENDKRISGTLKGWEKKYPLLETHVYYMFKTALTRRRGKNVLNSWYDKFDNMVK